jgi:hypothetical protein
MLTTRVSSKRALNLTLTRFNSPRSSPDSSLPDRTTHNATFGALHMATELALPFRLESTPQQPRRSISPVPPALQQAVCTTKIVDAAPSMPRRQNSRADALTQHLFNSTSSQHNAVFDNLATVCTGRAGGARANPFWDSNWSVDLPPSNINRNGSVSSALATMSLTSTTNAKKNQELPLAQVVRRAARIRGAQETWSCLQRDFYRSTACAGCAQELTCIQDLDFVQCPSCSQLTDLATAASSSSSACGGGGVGLGFTFDDLKRWELGCDQTCSEVATTTVGR